MMSFAQRLGAMVLGVLSGFDRIRLRGTLPRLSNTGSFYRWLEASKIRLTDFSSHAQSQTAQLREALEATAAEAGRPVEYLAGYKALAARTCCGSWGIVCRPPAMSLRA
jgi:hypothetical protein